LPEALIKIAESLMNSVRKSDICTRFGGDEFIICLPEANSQEASFLAERILNDIRRIELNVQGQVLKMTISIGVVTTNQLWKSDEIIKRADEALYKAKENGRNQIHVSV